MRATIITHPSGTRFAFTASAAKFRYNHENFHPTVDTRSAPTHTHTQTTPTTPFNPLLRSRPLVVCSSSNERTTTMREEDRFTSPGDVETREIARFRKISRKRNSLRSAGPRFAISPANYAVAFHRCVTSCSTSSLKFLTIPPLNP